MALPANVDTCTVTGSFVYADGSTPTGTVEFTQQACPILDASSTPPAAILTTPLVATLDITGAFEIDVPATDDVDLNPVDWTYLVRVRLDEHAYSFSMSAPAGTLDLAEVTPIISSTGTAVLVGPPGADGPPGEGVPEGGEASEVLAKASSDDFDTAWVPATAPGAHAATHAAASTDPVTLEQSQITGLVAGLAAKQPLDADLTTIAALSPGSDEIIQRKVGMWVSSTPTEYKTDLALVKGDVGLGNVNNTSDAAKPVSTATQTALNLKADKTTLVGGTTGQILSKVSATNYDTAWIDAAAGTTVFDDDDAGIVPASGGGSANFLRSDGTWAPSGASTGVSNTVTFSYNTTTTEPPTGNQLRLNSTTFSAATRLWVSQTTVDGLDIGIGLARVLTGYQIYFQDRDNAANWVKYNVTADGVDDGTYFDFAVAYHSGPGGIPAGQVELQSVSPGTSGTVRSINAQTGTTYTLVLTDAGKLVTLSNASAVTVTVPTNASVAFTIGHTIDLAQLGAGQVTVAGAGGVTVNATPSLALRAQYSAASLVKLAANTWLLVGDLETP